MKWRWILLLALMLSVGVNLGTLIAVWRQAPAETPANVAKPLPAPEPAAPVQAAPQPAAPQPAAPQPAAPQPAARNAEAPAVAALAPPVKPSVKTRARPSEPETREPPEAVRRDPPAPPPSQVAAPGEGARPEADDPRPPDGPPLVSGSGPVDPFRPEGPGGPRPGPPAPRFDRLAAELGLTPDQRARFFTSQRRYVEAGRSLRVRLRSSRIELTRLLSAEAADKTAVEKLLREQAELQAALDRELTSMLVEARGILTPEQYRRYARVVLTRLVEDGPGANGARAAPPPRRPGARRPRRFD